MIQYKYQIHRKSGEKVTELIRQLRKQLHEMPELAFHEQRTKQHLMEFIKKYTTGIVVDCGLWFYVKFEAVDKRKGSIAFRADMDAVCGADGKAGHYCGHDGHSSILAGFAVELSKRKLERDVYLIFQAAEETGEGARLCLDMLKRENIGEIYGMHNIPGFPLYAVLIRKGTFACASTGAELTFTGMPSHAAYPEAGRNPAKAIAKLVLELPFLCAEAEGILMATVIGVDLGSSAYGVSAAEGVLRLTIRGEYEREFQSLKRQIYHLAEKLAQEEELRLDICEIEPFPATENWKKGWENVERAAKNLGLSILYPEEPFRWSEDFGYYLAEVPGAMIGIGDGEGYPQLHTKEYEFPDEIMENVWKLWMEIVER